MKKVKFLSLALVLILGLSGCTYEEGPFVSVRSKTERVANTWVVGKAIIDGDEQASLDGFESLRFTAEGDATYIGSVLGVEYTWTGTWAFNDDNGVILLDVQDANNLFGWEEEMTILKLKEKELWVTYIQQNLTNNDVFYELHLIPAE